MAVVKRRGLLWPCTVLVLCAVTGCGGGDAPSREPGAAARGGDGERADARRGELLALACQACHALSPAGGPDIGPSLYGIFGRAAASLPDFDYSPALREAGFIWSPVELDRWLQAPTSFLPGTTMVFAGYADPRDRRALIEWLQAATAPPAQ